MSVTFLLGPAGTGKTYRCLTEIRNALMDDPAGPPLLFLAPKQATFQLERQLLADPTLTGYTRLHILSFERLARWVHQQFQVPLPPVLDEEGRVMVLRALLADRHSDLRLFRASARLPGFAVSLSGLLREFQRHLLSVDELVQLQQRLGPGPLSEKIHDVSLMLHAYRAWLQEHGLEDSEHLLDAAATLLKNHAGTPLDLSGVWMDGFAEMTPQEVELLAALMLHTRKATLAFCLEPQPPETTHWLNPWILVNGTYQRCLNRLGKGSRHFVQTETLLRSANTRFESPSLKHLEQNWHSPIPYGMPLDGSVLTVACSHPEAEAIAAARMICRHVREGGRYRETAILLRSFAGYDDVLPRILARYGIPFFMDRRESVTHHPVAELTRFGLRTLAFGWRSEDWIGALKTGLAGAGLEAVDRLENAALRFGWSGEIWISSQPLPNEPSWFDEYRKRLVPPFLELSSRFRQSLDGPAFAEALHQWWRRLDVAETLEKWDRETSFLSAPHRSVMEQLEQWLENIALAFKDSPMELREWLTIVEAGLASLSVGTIPPSLDQVLIGTIDRSRNPDLKITFVLGLNEGIFPSPPTSLPLLSDAEREALESQNVFIGSNWKEQIGHERYLAYIACTRSRHRLVATFSERNVDGNPLNPSPFILHLENQLFDPSIRRHFSPNLDWPESEHLCELLPFALRSRRAEATAWPTEVFSDWSALIPKLDLLHPPRPTHLDPSLAEQIYGNPLKVSVSDLERYAQCPFKFFIARGLRAQERKILQLDARERGNFQHEVLEKFHQHLCEQKKRWRDLDPEEGQKLIQRLGEETMLTSTVFSGTPEARFACRSLLGSLQQLMGALLQWMETYQLDPTLVEFAFGMENDQSAPPWSLRIDETRSLELRGRIDRIDLCRLEDGRALAVVIDYKSSPKKPDETRLYNGLELQLAAYLCVLQDIAPLEPKFQGVELVPGGVFYVSLKGGPSLCAHRGPGLVTKSPFMHAGRFNFSVYEWLDAGGSENASGQFHIHPASKNKMEDEQFQHLLERTRFFITEFGKKILSGAIDIAPYKKGTETACDYCEYQGICRFDAWIEPFRPLLPVPKKEKPEKKTPKRRGATS